MTWTTRTPTQPGWYWYKEEEARLVVHVYKTSGPLYVCFGTGSLPIDAVTGEWSSEPIKEPEEV